MYIPTIKITFASYMWYGPTLCNIVQYSHIYDSSPYFRYTEYLFDTPIISNTTRICTIDREVSYYYIEPTSV